MRGERILRRVIAAAVAIGLGATLASCKTMGDLADLDPTRETYDEFEGRYIDTLPAGKWRAGAKGVAAAILEIPPGETMALREFAGLVPNRRLERYLTGLADKLMANMPVENVPYRIVVAADPLGAKTIAMPDGYIAINITMLAQLDSEDAVAALLAHELSHVILRHHNERWIAQFRERVEGAAAIGLSVASNVSEAAAKFGGNMGDTGRITTIVAISAALTREAIDTGLMPAWDREQEDFADILATDMLVRAGYSPDGMQYFLQALINQTKHDIARAELTDAARAKLEQERKEKMVAKFQEAGLQGVLEEFTGLFVKSLKKMRSEMRARHRDAEKRQESNFEYILREYEDLEGQETVAGDWLKLKNSREVRSLITSYDKAWLALQDATNGDLRAAEANIRSARRGAAANQPAIWYAFATVRRAQDDPANAIDNLRRGIRQPGSGFFLRQDLTELLMARSEWSEADKVADAAWKRFGKPSDLLPSMIAIKVQADNKPGANALNLECQAKHRVVAEKCAEALQGGPPA